VESGTVESMARKMRNRTSTARTASCGDDFDATGEEVVVGFSAVATAFLVLVAGAVCSVGIALLEGATSKRS
jgi:hypothetical protein